MAELNCVGGCLSCDQTGRGHCQGVKVGQIDQPGVYPIADRLQNQPSVLQLKGEG